MEKRQDLISRQTAIDEWKNDFKGYVNALNIPRDDYNGIMEYIDELPSAQQERPTGEWIVSESEEVGALNIRYKTYTCPSCRWSNSLIIPRNFCPNCGADMRGKHNDND